MSPLARWLALPLVCLFVQSAPAYACGALGERLCNLFDDGRGGCDPNLVDVLGRCQRPNICGAEGQRLCFLFIDGRGGCNTELVDTNGTCARPNCGGSGQNACALVGRDSCNSGFVEVNDMCFARADCGAVEQRVCLVGEREGKSCDANLVERGGRCIRPNCGGVGQTACAIVGRTSCDDDLVEMNDTCFTRGACGEDGQRACLAGERVGNSCNANLVESGGMCIATNCGASGQAACSVFGRNSCNDGLVEFKNTCVVRGDCGSRGQRYCLLGERKGDHCNANLIENRGVCVPCGTQNERACATIGRKSCDEGLVEFNDSCRLRADCGQAGQRACLIGEREGRSCDANLFERSGKCLQCGALGQAACAIVGRSSCDGDLVEVNDLCLTKNDCGFAGQRACLIGERTGKSCNEGLFEEAGVCHRCGTNGQRACAIFGRNSCDAGFVEINNTCFTRAACGASGQRACLFGERKAASCDKGLVERNGSCGPLVPDAGIPPRVFVFVRTNPSLPVLRSELPVFIVASPVESATGRAVTASRIEILQATYFGADSRAPVVVKTCNDSQECAFEVPKTKTLEAISYQARVMTDGESFESPIRVTDVRFVAAPMRMNVAAEVTGKNLITEMPHNRAIDIVLFAGTGYEFQTSIGAEVFSTRLKGELETMLGISPGRPSSIAENFGAVNFYVAVAPGTVNPYNLLDMCEHSTAGAVPWGNAQGILHPFTTCRDWSVPGPFYSAAAPYISRHELHHAAFGMSDEYCVGTLHTHNALSPNVYRDQGECMRLGSNPAACKRIADREDCVDPNCACSTSYWRSDPLKNDLMNVGHGDEQADDRRAIRRRFAECRLGRC